MFDVLFCFSNNDALTSMCILHARLKNPLGNIRHITTLIWFRSCLHTFLLRFGFVYQQRSLPLNFVTLSHAHKLAEDALVQSVFADLPRALLGVNTLCRTLRSASLIAVTVHHCSPDLNRESVTFLTRVSMRSVGTRKHMVAFSNDTRQSCAHGSADLFSLL